MNYLTKILDLMFKISILKTLRINITYFGFKGLRLPILVGKRVEFKKLSGSIEIPQYKTGLIKIGLNDVGHFAQHSTYCVIQNTGKIIFKGKITLGIGIAISNKGLLIFGNNDIFTADSKIICHNQIEFGDDCIISWNTQFMDTDQQEIYSLDNIRLNPDAPIKIGNNCWICCNVIVLKGTNIANNVVVAANNTVTKNITSSNVIVGKDNRIINDNIYFIK